MSKSISTRIRQYTRFVHYTNTYRIPALALTPSNYPHLPRHPRGRDPFPLSSPFRSKQTAAKDTNDTAAKRAPTSWRNCSRIKRVSCCLHPTFQMLRNWFSLTRYSPGRRHLLDGPILIELPLKVSSTRTADKYVRLLAHKLGNGGMESGRERRNWNWFVGD